MILYLGSIDLPAKEATPRLPSFLICAGKTGPDLDSATYGSDGTQTFE